ncbi:MAG: hypothetical protein OXB93_04355 [Cytophagales bacterium]|nr:hypothetical protein [Cytophagales bacterium]
MAEDNRIFGNNEKLRNGFFSMLGDADSEQKRKAEIRRLIKEFLGYENMPKQIAQFKQQHKFLRKFCLDLETYWWGENGDRRKFRKMTDKQQDDYLFRMSRYLSSPEHGGKEPPKFTYRHAIYYEIDLIISEEEEERHREERQSQKAKQQETLTQPTQT